MLRSHLLLHQILALRTPTGHKNRDIQRSLHLDCEPVAACLLRHLLGQTRSQKSLLLV